MGFPGSSVVKNWPVNAGDGEVVNWNPGLGRFPGGGNGNSLQYSCPGNPWAEESVGCSPWSWKELDTTEQLSTACCNSTAIHKPKSLHPKYANIVLITLDISIRIQLFLYDLPECLTQ